MGYYSSMFILIPAMILSMYAQYKVNNTFNKYSRVGSKKGYTGADVARTLLTNAGIRDVQVEMVKGHLTDHYDPRAKVLRLSQSVYGSTSIAALGVAAHETGHAIQHSQGYSPLTVRNNILPAVMIGSNMSKPLFMLGLFFSAMTRFNSLVGAVFLYLGIGLFALTVLFQIITLPVEFNASNRAIALLSDNHFLTEEEVTPARKVLSAAALTYVASAAAAISSLLRLIFIARGRND